MRHVVLNSLLLVATASGAASAARPTDGAVTAERLKVPSGPGSVRGLAGEPTVDPFFAQVNYQVPLEMPAGLGGLTPSLALTYSGALGNGPVGIGWGLAMPRIQRSTRLGVPRFDVSDEFEIAGIVSGRLIAIGNGEYRVEAMGQTVRVKQVGDGFEVDDGSGVHYRLGAVAASRQESGPRTLAWLCEEVTNQAGERIGYTYTKDQGQIYLSSLTWGPTGIYTAVLSYDPRPDVVRSFREGFSVVTAKRLSSVTIKVGGIERRSYALQYDDTFRVARLSGVTSKGVAHNGDWPALSFTYAPAVTPPVEPIAGIESWRLNVQGTTLVDLDGDGAADLLQLSPALGHSYRLNRNGTFLAPQTLTGNSQTIDSLQLQDVDGDARPELLAETSSGWQVFRWGKTAWSPQGTWPGTQGLPLKRVQSARYADLNGDGLVDAIQWNNDGLLVRMASRTGLGGPPQTLLPRIGGTTLPTSDGRFVDMNGDGLDDYVLIGVNGIDRFLGHGDGTFEPVIRVPFPTSGEQWNPQNVELGDLDRDGLVDLVRVDLGRVRWFRGNADGTFATTAVILNSPESFSSDGVVVALTDSNGNGSLDVVWSSTNGMWRLDLAGATTAGMLTHVQNGLGMDVRFDYQSSHALSATADAGGTPWSSTVPIAMPVPVQKLTALGAGETTRQVTYSVRDGVWDAIEQRFAGFLTTTVTTWGATPAETGSVITRYQSGTGDNPRVLRGKPQNEQVRDGTGKRLSFTTYTWEARPVTGLPDVPLLRVAVMTSSRVRHEDTSPPREVGTTYEFDGFGRETRRVENGRTDVTGDESVHETRYGDDDITWVRNRVCEEKVTALDGTVASDVQHLFGDEATTLDLFQVGKGWPRATRAWLEEERRWVTQLTTEYDAHGNPVLVSTGGVERHYVYDANGLFPTEEHLTAPSRELVWQANWDPVLGALTQVTEPNGHIVHIRYDSLGRYTGESIDDRQPHHIIEYDWTSPFPKTTTWVFDGALADVTAKPATWSADRHWRQSVEVANGKGEVRYHALRLSDAQWIISSYHEVDPNDRVVFAGRPVLAPQLELSARPAGIVGDTLAYDPLGRLIEQRLPTGARRTYRYVTFERTMQEADLAPVHSVLDGKGRAILTERSLPDGTHEIVQASYDSAGRLTQMTLSGGTVTRSFTYDTLGRLVQSLDPDLGARTLTWDDGNRLRSETNAVGQTVRYSYDNLGRLATRDTGSMFRYHYDDARPGAGGALSNLVGELAWIEEPTGGIDLGYDDFGRVTFSRRRVDAQLSEFTTRYAASGLVLGKRYDDGFALTYQYDPAGRLIQVGDLWSLLEQDPMGQPLHERTASGVDTRTVRDVLGLPSEIDIHDAGGTALYHVRAARNAWTAITSVADLDGTGLDHTATYAYDGFARLTSATLGTGAQGFSFGYAYDVLHNMTARTASGPRALGALLGTYRYAETGRAPRQLTSIVDPAGQVTHRFGYDAAGRQTAQDQQTMTYDASDRLLRVDGAPGGSVAHLYGHDGARLKTTAPDGSASYFFGDGTALRHGVREHDVDVGSRVVARVSLPGGTASRAASFGAMLGATVSFSARALGLVLLGVALLLGRRWSRRRARAAAMAGLVLAAGCSSPGVGTYRASLSAAATATFLHTGLAAGPTVFTDADGHLLEERRYEPFGVPVDAKFHTATGDTVGAPDLAARDLNELNKRTEATTGWSDHGARWMAPETGRWLSTDPPVAAPDDTFMFAPWALHPYQYVHQNPVIYWDPDGRFVWFVALVVVAVLVETEGAANAPTPTTPPERIIPSPTNADIAWGAGKVGLAALGGAGASGLVGRTIAKGALAGGTAAVIGQGVDDVHHGQFSGFDVYAENAFFGAATGAALAAAGKMLGPRSFASEGMPINPSDLPVPAGGRQGLAELTKWTTGGRGLAGQRANFVRTEELIKQLPDRIDVLRAGGVTKDMAQQWAEFYRQIGAANPATATGGNPNALPRAKLMQAIADEL